MLPKTYENICIIAIGMYIFALILSLVSIFGDFNSTVRMQLALTGVSIVFFLALLQLIAKQYVVIKKSTPISLKITHG